MENDSTLDQTNMNQESVDLEEPPQQQNENAQVSFYMSRNANNISGYGVNYQNQSFSRSIVYCKELGLSVQQYIEDQPAENMGDMGNILDQIKQQDPPQTDQTQQTDTSQYDIDNSIFDQEPPQFPQKQTQPCPQQKSATANQYKILIQPEESNNIYNQIMKSKYYRGIHSYKSDIKDKYIYYECCRATLIYLHQEHEKNKTQSWQKLYLKDHKFNCFQCGGEKIRFPMGYRRMIWEKSHQKYQPDYYKSGRYHNKYNYQRQQNRPNNNYYREPNNHRHFQQKKYEKGNGGSYHYNRQKQQYSNNHGYRQKNNWQQRNNRQYDYYNEMEKNNNNRQLNENFNNGYHHHSHQNKCPSVKYQEKYNIPKEKPSAQPIKYKEKPSLPYKEKISPHTPEPSKDKADKDHKKDDCDEYQEYIIYGFKKLVKKSTDVEISLKSDNKEPKTQEISCIEEIGRPEQQQGIMQGDKNTPIKDNVETGVNNVQSDQQSKQHQQSQIFVESKENQGCKENMQSNNEPDQLNPNKSPQPKQKQQIQPNEKQQQAELIEKQQVQPNQKQQQAEPNQKQSLEPNEKKETESNEKQSSQPNQKQQAEPNEKQQPQLKQPQNQLQAHIEIQIEENSPKQLSQQNKQVIQQKQRQDQQQSNRSQCGQVCPQNKNNQGGVNLEEKVDNTNEQEKQQLESPENQQVQHNSSQNFQQHQDQQQMDEQKKDQEISSQNHIKREGDGDREEEQKEKEGEHENKEREEDQKSEQDRDDQKGERDDQNGERDIEKDQVRSKSNQQILSQSLQQIPSNDGYSKTDQNQFAICQQSECSSSKQQHSFNILNMLDETNKENSLNPHSQMHDESNFMKKDQSIYDNFYDNNYDLNNYQYESEYSRNQAYDNQNYQTNQEKRFDSEITESLKHEEQRYQPPPIRKFTLKIKMANIKKVTAKTIQTKLNLRQEDEDQSFYDEQPEEMKQFSLDKKSKKIFHDKQQIQKTSLQIINPSFKRVLNNPDPDKNPDEIEHSWELAKCRYPIQLLKIKMYCIKCDKKSQCIDDGFDKKIFERICGNKNCGEDIKLMIVDYCWGETVES